MSLGNGRRLLIFGIIAAAVLLADQVTKQLVVAYIPVNTGTEVLPGLLNLVHVRNPGAAFGFLSGFEGAIRPLFFIGVSVVALAVITWLVLSSADLPAWMMTAYALFFAGAAGNLVDRLLHGEVVDFLDFHVGEWHWPAFNMADSALSVATGMFIIYVLFMQPEKES